MWASGKNGAVYEIISKNSNDQQTLVLVSEIERSFRNSMMVLNSAYKAKTGIDVLDSRQYYQELQTLIVKVFSDLKANGKFFDELSGNIDFDVNTVLSQTPDIFQNLIAPELFRNEFLESFVANVEFGKLTEAVSTYLSKQIELMPVGISLRPMDFTSTLRFGDKVFTGNYFLFNTIRMRAYERGPQTNLGVFHSVLNLRKDQKKAVAVAVDRTHRALDVLNGFSGPRDRIMHSCGSFAPFTFFKEGIWPRTFGIAVPATPLVTAWVFRKLKLTNSGSWIVKAPSKQDVSKRWYFVPLAVAHDLGLVVLELKIIGGVATVGAVAILKSLNLQTGEVTEIEIDENADETLPEDRRK